MFSMLCHLFVFKEKNRHSAGSLPQKYVILFLNYWTLGNKINWLNLILIANSLYQVFPVQKIGKLTTRNLNDLHNIWMEVSCFSFTLMHLEINWWPYWISISMKLFKSLSVRVNAQLQCIQKKKTDKKHLLVNEKNCDYTIVKISIA